jgi:hypothetical protein
VEVDDPACRHSELRDTALGHARVEDHRCVGASFVGGQVVDDLVAARLLLAVAGEANVDRQLTCRGQLGRGLHEHVQLTLVVDDPARVEPFAALLEREGVGLPEVERVGRLDVDVPVDEHGRRARAVGGGGQVAEDQRVRVCLDHLCRAACPAHELRQPLRGVADVAGARRVGADARDAQQLGELVEPGLGHGRGVY